jgi:hypothetical protein
MDNKSLKLFVGSNIISVVFALTLNFLAVLLPINNKTTAELSELYPNYFVPAGFTFSIWGIIYLLLIAFMFYQGFQYYKNNQATNKIISNIGPWFFISGLANGSWILAWHYEFVSLSVVIMLVLLYSLLKIYTTVQSTRPHKLWDNVFILTMSSVYLGWISVATIANVTALLVSKDWSGLGISEPMWASVMIIIAALLGILAILNRQDIPYALVIIWAIWGIFSKQSVQESEASQMVASIAKYAGTMLFIYSILTSVGRRTYYNLPQS